MVLIGIFVTISLLLSSCKKDSEPDFTSPQDPAKVGIGQVAHAIAVIHPTEGNVVSGIVAFHKTDDGINVMVNLQGLSQGEHGFHIHEYGDCNAADGSSAGGHFAPRGGPHGARNDPSDKRHVGDLGNIKADAEGNVHYEWTAPFLAFQGPNSIIGRAVIIHDGKDDLTSQPSGNAGSRVACGVIGIAKE